MSSVSRRSILKMPLCTGVAAAASPIASVKAGRKRIVFFTDLHTRVEWGTPEALARASRAIALEQPDLILCGGDTITDGFQSGRESLTPRWNAYLDFHRSLPLPAHVTLGNHDLVGAHPEDGTKPEADPRAVFRETFGLEKTWYTFDALGIRFLVLDSIEVLGFEEKYRGFIPEEQQEWIQDVLGKTSPDMPIILISHMPFLSLYKQVTVGAEAPMTPGRVVVNSRDVLKYFEQHRLLAVLQGHLHVHEWLQWGSRHFITGGAVCAKWWRGPWYGTEEGFGVLDWDGSTISWRYVDYGWDARRPPDQ